MFIEVFRALASRQRMFGEMQLAERDEPESNILQVDPRNPAKLLAMELLRIHIGGLRTRQDSELWRSGRVGCPAVAYS